MTLSNVVATIVAEGTQARTGPTQMLHEAYHSLGLDSKQRISSCSLMDIMNSGCEGKSSMENPSDPKLSANRKKMKAEHHLFRFTPARMQNRQT